MIGTMSRDRVNTLCAALPGAEWSKAFGPGHDVWKVGGKVFASAGFSTPGVALKCAGIDEALHLEDLFGWPKAPYFHRSWVLVPFDTAEDELAHRVAKSYRTVRAGLTKKAQAALPPFE
jgi:predicted DNA-binding protein (MmcQ/YjbR family)